MLNFRQFEAGPDPFGRTYQVLFKWLQTAISLRHSDTVDVKFVLVDADDNRVEKTIAMQHADLVRLSGELQRKMDDPWCARLAALHLIYLVTTGEDMEKSLITVMPADLKRHADEVARAERAELQTA